MSILIFFIVLFVLVLVHELGHFVVAKLTKMRVDEFGIGFPPRLFSVQKGETRYSFNLFPIGGFVKIWGEDGAHASSSPVSSETGDDRYEQSESGQEGINNPPSRSFSSRPRWMQALVLIAGVTMNILLAWALFVVVFVTGTYTSVPESEASADAPLTIVSILPESPIAQAEVPLGSEVVALSTTVDDLDELTPSAFREFVRLHAEEPITLVYVNGDSTEEVSLKPVRGLSSDSDVAIVGAGLSLIEVVRLPIHEALGEAAVLTVTTLRDITVGLGTLLLNAVQLKADLSQVAGPVGIVGLVDEASSFGLSALLMFTAFISLNLAVINLLPFPALDGGRLLMVGIEVVKRSPISPNFVGAANSIGFIILILLMVAVTFNDVLRIL